MSSHGCIACTTSVGCSCAWPWSFVFVAAVTTWTVSSESSKIIKHQLEWQSGKSPHRLDLLKGEAQAFRVLRPLEAGEHACEWKALSAQQYGAG